MKKRVISVAAILALLCCLIGIFPVSAEAGATWTSGNAAEWEYGLIRLTATDTRGYVEAPDLDKAPYYLLLGMDGLMPGGAEADGGRWGQLHISNGERNPNWNPAGDLYITFPNANANPCNVKVVGEFGGTSAFAGVTFGAKTLYLFKFAKEKNAENTDVLAVYCNGEKVFEGADQLDVFKGEKLWFLTNGNVGDCDTFKDYPLLIDPDVKIESDPTSYFFAGPKWGNDRFNTLPMRDIFATYDADGTGHMYFPSVYGDTDQSQSIATSFENPNKVFEMHLNCPVFNYETWEVIGLRPLGEEGAPLDEPNVLCVEISSGPKYQMFFKRPDSARIDLVAPIFFDEGGDFKLRFEVIKENGVKSVNIYGDDRLLCTNSDNDLVYLMESEALRAITVGHNPLSENPNQLLMKIDNDPPEVVPVDPGSDIGREEDGPYADLVLTSVNEKITVDGLTISAPADTTVATLEKALKVPDRCKIYVMNADETLATSDVIIDSTTSVMLVLDDGYDTYIRSYNISSPGSSNGNSRYPYDAGDWGENPPTGDTGLYMMPLALALLALLLTVKNKCAVRQ